MGSFPETYNDRKSYSFVDVSGVSVACVTWYAQFEWERWRGD